MEILISQNLKKLRKEKNISQEQLAKFLNISFQAISKWETGIAYPDITLLPRIARFLGVSIDELLGVHEIAQNNLYKEYYDKGSELCRNAKNEESLELWLEAHRELPNNFNVKQYLMSSYYDADEKKYFNEIIEIANDILNNDHSMWNKGQAIRIMANTYYENGDTNMAINCAKKSVPLYCSADYLLYRFFEGEKMLDSIRYNVHWIMQNLWGMCTCIVHDENASRDTKYKQDTLKTLLKIYEIVYPNKDTHFDTLFYFYWLYANIARYGIMLNDDEKDIRNGLENAFECAIMSLTIEKHILSTPLVDKTVIEASPSSDWKYRIIQQMKMFLENDDFDIIRERDWFKEIQKSLGKQ